MTLVAKESFDYHWEKFEVMLAKLLHVGLWFNVEKFGHVSLIELSYIGRCERCVGTKNNQWIIHMVETNDVQRTCSNGASLSYLCTWNIDIN